MFRQFVIRVVLLLLLPFFPEAKAQTPSVYVARYKGNKVCAVSYTFDDGLEEQYTVLFPQLKKYGIKATFYIWGKGIERPEYQFGKPRMTWQQMREMVADGQEVSSHTWSHPNNMPQLTDSEIRDELVRNDTAIFHHTGVYPYTLAYPGNNMSERVVKIASEGRIATRTSQFAVGEDVSHVTPERLHKWLVDLLKNHAWGVTMSHGIINGYDCFHNPSVLWNHFREVSTMRNHIWIATFREVAAYTREQQHIRLSISKNDSGYVVKPILPLDKRLYREWLTMVVLIKNAEFVRVSQDGQPLPVTALDGKALFDFNPYGSEIKIRTY